MDPLLVPILGKTSKIFIKEDRQKDRHSLVVVVHIFDTPALRKQKQLDL